MTTEQKWLDLLVAAKEAHEALVLAFKALKEHPRAFDNWQWHCYKAGVREGFGMRLQNAIAACEEQNDDSGFQVPSNAASPPQFIPPVAAEYGEAAPINEQLESIAPADGETGLDSMRPDPSPVINIPVMSSSFKILEYQRGAKAGEYFRITPVPDGTYGIIQNPGDSNYRLAPGGGGQIRYRASSGEILIPVIATGTHHIVLYVGGK